MKRCILKFRFLVQGLPGVKLLLSLSCPGGSHVRAVSSYVTATDKDRYVPVKLHNVCR